MSHAATTTASDVTFGKMERVNAKGEGEQLIYRRGETIGYIYKYNEDGNTGYTVTWFIASGLPAKADADFEAYGDRTMRQAGAMAKDYARTIASGTRY